jgi:hypothetical protein
MNDEKKSEPGAFKKLSEDPRNNPGQWDLRWLDHAQQPREPPDPKYPEGIEIDASMGKERFCTVHLEYPARGVGMYFVRCLWCGANAGLRTAGRPDDPKLVKIACKPKDPRNRVRR